MMVLDADSYATPIISITSANKILVLQSGVSFVPVHSFYRLIGQLNNHLHNLQTINNGCYITLVFVDGEMEDKLTN